MGCTTCRCKLIRQVFWTVLECFGVFWSVCAFMFLSVCLFICVSVYCLCANLCVCQCVCLLVYLCAHLCVCLVCFYSLKERATQMRQVTESHHCQRTLTSNLFDFTKYLIILFLFFSSHPLLADPSHNHLTPVFLSSCSPVLLFSCSLSCFSFNLFSIFPLFLFSCSLSCFSFNLFSVFLFFLHLFS